MYCYARDFRTDRVHDVKRRVVARLLAADQRADQEDVCLSHLLLDLVNRCLSWNPETHTVSARPDESEVCLPFFTDALPLGPRDIMANRLSVTVNAINCFREIGAL